MKKNAKNAKNLCLIIRRELKIIIFQYVILNTNNIMTYLKLFLRSAFKKGL